MDGLIPITEAPPSDVGKDHEDYSRFLTEYGFHEEQVRGMVDNPADQAPMPAGQDLIAQRPSKIHGVGNFAAKEIAAGQVIAPARLGGRRTPAGRYTNHSATPNASMRTQPNGDMVMVARRPIGPDEEVTVDYRQSGRVNGSGARPDLAESVRTLRRKYSSQG